MKYTKKELEAYEDCAKVWMVIIVIAKPLLWIKDKLD